MIHPGIEPHAPHALHRVLGRVGLTAALTLAGFATVPTFGQDAAPAASTDKPAQTAKPRSASKQAPPARAVRTSGRQRAIVTPPRAVLVFPTDGKGGVSDQIGDVITETIQGRIAASGRYQTVYFLRSIPTVARALNESTLTSNEVSHPFDDDTKLRKLMPQSGFDMALTTSVDSYTYDPAKNQVTLLVSARLIDYRGEKPVVRAAAENASSAENGGNAKELTLATQVAKSIAEKLMTSLLTSDRGAQTPAAAAPAAAGK